MIAWFRSQSAGNPALAGLGASVQISCVSGDASFRRYFRAANASGNVMLMDSPPQREPVTPFLQVAETLGQQGVSVPRILASDVEQGFICLEDFGDELLLAPLRQAADKGDVLRAETLYYSAFEELLKIQAADTASLPAYDEVLLQREMALFRDWLCEGWLGLTLSPAERGLLQDCFDRLTVQALGQPRAFVHRDFHSRNLMLRRGQSPGVLDFQDAVYGPFSYDLVSLLKDCYVAWPREQVRDWVMAYRARAQEKGLPDVPAQERLWEDFELMGVQRHLKAAGIFARLFMRDGKPGYLGDIPRTLGYIEALGSDYDHIASLRTFRDWLSERVLPVLDQRLQEHGERQG